MTRLCYTTRRPVLQHELRGHIPMASTDSTSAQSGWEEEERKKIDERRTIAFGEDREIRAATEPHEDLVGLALSGGGIRSALYNDGFLQGLSHHGFLRYVDYLSSVSGGGYIAGHLTSLAEPASEDTKPGGNPTQNNSDPPKPDASPADQDDGVNTLGTKNDDSLHFHDDPKRWTLGRDPVTGIVDKTRLSGIGRYLSRPMLLLPRLFFSWFFSVAFYVGALGIVATLMALFWRTFDAPIFRVIYFEVLSIEFGDELLIAFIPTIVVGLLWFAFTLLITACRVVDRLVNKRDRLANSRGLSLFHQAALAVLGLSCLASLAIFLGNGKTFTSAGGDKPLLLNHYAQGIAIVAGLLQILLFFGSDRLLLSEKAEAKHWQRYLQRFLTYGMMAFVIFGFIHWMGREDISKYSENRDAYLQLGDIGDWYAISQVFDSEVKKTIPDFLDHDKMYAKSRWERALAGRRWEFSAGIKPDDLNPETPENHEERKSDQWLIGHRIWMAAQTYWYSLTIPEERRLSETCEWKEPDKDCAKNARSCYTAITEFRRQQRSQIELWNQSLQTFEFTQKLLKRISEKSTDKTELTWSAQVTSENAEPTDWTERVLKTEKKETTAADPILTFIKDHPTLPENRKKTLLEAATRRFDETSSLPSVQEKIVSLNRLLLEEAYPIALRERAIPSTYVVPPYDQRARLSWLVFWIGLAAIGISRDLFFGDSPSLYEFYRRQIADNFLLNNTGSKELNELNPTSDGLPFPLILATSLEPVKSNGSYIVQHKPFLFTPLKTGDFASPKDSSKAPDNDSSRADQDPIGIYDSSEISFSKCRENRVTFGDAVTLSGAAVSPLMTNNRVLSVLVDFFRSDLGREVFLDAAKSRERWKRTGIVVISAIAFTLAIWWICRFHYLPAALALCLSAGVSLCLLLETGAPYFLKTLIFPKNVNPSETPKKNDLPTARYIADGGFYDYLGVSELLRRRCKLIVVSDAGANVGDQSLGTLAKMCERMTAVEGVQILDLDHESPIDFGRLETHTDSNDQRLVHQPYVCFRFRYDDGSEGLMIYCQMGISAQDPIEIQQIRQRFPSFPDEPTTNQFYVDEQVSAYRLLGYFIASRMCRELERWEVPNLRAAAAQRGRTGVPSRSNSITKLNAFAKSLRPSTKSEQPLNGQPLFDILINRLLTAYRLSCYEEISFRDDDIYCEAVWPVSDTAFPQLQTRVDEWLNSEFTSETMTANDWIAKLHQSADLRNAYRKAALEDINQLQAQATSYCSEIWRYLLEQCDHCSQDAPTKSLAAQRTKDQNQLRQTLLTAHLCAIAVTCQEIHRGSPHATFQIGGREKLVELASRISAVTIQSLRDPSKDALGDSSDRSLDQVMGEIVELKRSVFQGGESATTVSFIQCMVLSWGWMQREHLTACDASPFLLKTIEELGTKSSGPGDSHDWENSEASVVEIRCEIDKGLEKTNLAKVLKAMKRLWHLGFRAYAVSPAADAGRSGSEPEEGPKPSPKNSSDPNAGHNKAISSRFAHRKRYDKAVEQDTTGALGVAEPATSVLWNELYPPAQRQTDKSRKEQLTNHLACIAIACKSLPQNPPALNPNQAELQEACEKLSEFFVEQQEQVRESPVDELLKDQIDGLLTHVSQIAAVLKFDSDQETGRFARSITMLFARFLRDGRSQGQLSFLDYPNPLLEVEDNIASANGLERYGDSRNNSIGSQIRTKHMQDATQELQLEWYAAIASAKELQEIGQGTNRDAPHAT